MKALKYGGLLLMLLGLVFVWAETAYFGWNWEPGSVQERMCDALSLVLVISGGICLLVAKHIETTSP